MLEFLARNRETGGLTWSQAWKGSSPVSIWWLVGHSRRNYMELPPSMPTTCREGHQDRIRCKPVGRQRQKTEHADSWQGRLVPRMRDVTFLAKKGPKLEMERYQLDILGLTSIHYPGRGTRLLERGCTLSFFQNCSR